MRHPTNTSRVPWEDALRQIGQELGAIAADEASSTRRKRPSCMACLRAPRHQQSAGQLQHVPRNHFSGAAREHRPARRHLHLHLNRVGAWTADLHASVSSAVERSEHCAWRHHVPPLHRTGQSTTFRSRTSKSPRRFRCFRKVTARFLTSSYRTKVGPGRLGNTREIWKGLRLKLERSQDRNVAQTD
jgi:hypothetical protein